MSDKTLTYSENVQGWPSFYSFYPDWMIGMNKFFYSFKGGNLYRHNVNEDRNTFYQDWWIRKTGNAANAFTPSSIKSVFNDTPVQNKLFKTLSLEGDDVWDAVLYTDIQNTGFVEKEWFQKKEQSYYAFVRNAGSIPSTPTEYQSRSMNGIGKSEAISLMPLTEKIMFSIDPLVIIGNSISVGDYLYFSLAPYTELKLAGAVLEVKSDYPAGNNYIIVDRSTSGSVPIIGASPYFMYMKSSVAESQGVLGHYAVFELTNSNVNKIELFEASSEVMKSYP